MLNTRSSLRNKVLNYFFLNQEERTYINEMARILQADPKNVHRALTRLEEEGILASEFSGKERYFFCRTKHPLYKSYREIFLKTVGLEGILKEEIKKIEGLNEAWLFGSYARNQYGPESDIDLLLVGQHKPLEAQKVIFQIQKKIAREISVVNMKPDELTERKAKGDQFVKTVFGGKVIKLL